MNLPPKMLDVRKLIVFLFNDLASCDYWRWGSGGRQENINAICILGLNHINDKVLFNNLTRLG